MIVESPHRIATAVATAAAIVLVVVHARACRARGDIAVPPAIAAAPVAAAKLPAAPVAARVATPPSPAAAPGDGSGIPRVALPCIDGTTALVARGDRPVLCWDGRCLAEPGDPTSIVPRPPAPEGLATTEVIGGRLCTGTKCDRIGPRLRAAMADMSPLQVSATRDHAAVVLADGSDYYAAWNRVEDRPIDLGPETESEGEVVRIEVTGDRLLVARSCNEYCSSVARIIDARGRRHGDACYSDAELGDDRASIIALDADHTVVLGRFGEVAMIEHGLVAASASLLPGGFSHPQRAIVERAVRLDDRTLAVMWCLESDSDPTCHLMRLRAQPAQPGLVRADISPIDDRLLPRCPRG